MSYFHTYEFIFNVYQEIITSSYNNKMATI